MSANTPELNRTHRFVREDFRSLASYLDIALETLENGAAPTTDAITILRRVRWHLTATPSRHDEITSLTADQSAYLAPRRVATLTKPRTVLDAVALENLLRQASPELANLCIEDLHPLSGGRSKLMAVVLQSGCSVLPPRFVFRQDWSSAITGTSVTKEYAIACSAHAAGIATPAPLLLCEPEVNGENPFLLMEFAPGVCPGDLFSPPMDADLAYQLATQLGRLHSIPVQPLLNAGVERRSDTPAILEKARVRFSASNAALGQGSPIISLALTRMSEMLPDQPAELAMIHGDLGFHNVLAVENQLIGLIDWEFSHCGYPAEDLGYIRGDIEQVIEWDAFMAAYHEAGGPPIAALEIDFFQLWGLVRLYILLIQARAALRAGFTRDPGVARMCVDWIPRLLTTLDECLARIGRTK